MSEYAAAQSLLEDFAGWVNDAHGQKTPKRFAEMLHELTACSKEHHIDNQSTHIDDCIKWADFPAEEEQDMIVLKAIPFTSVCNHHVIPIIGNAYIAYVPQEKIAGLSKFARVTKHFARQLQVQERLTTQIADFLYNKLDPKGLGVIIEAEHMCMTIRGVQTPGTTTITSSMRGVFADHSKTAKAEFLAFFNSKGR